MVKKNWKRFMAAVLMSVMVVSFTACSQKNDNDSKAQTESTDKKSESADKKSDSADQAEQITVSLTVDGSKAKDAGYDVDIQKDVKLDKDGNLLDALDAAGVSYSGDGYVSTIEGLAEKAVTDTSGWTYTVNDKMVETAADKTVLKDGDKVVWSYVTSWE